MKKNYKHSNKIKISIIIPAYNVESYIEKCLESVMNQSYKNLEVIVIDDGSTDATNMIIESFCGRYDTIHSIHTENNGQQMARKRGIELASGDYVVFIDGDDYVSPSYVEDMVKNADGVDFVSSGLNKLDTNGNIIDRWTDNYPAGVYRNEEDVKRVFSELIIYPKNRRKQFIGGVINSQCCKLFKREIVEKMYVDASAGRISNEEDWMFVLLYMLKCRSFCFIDAINYFYRYNSHSVVHNMHDDYLSGCAAFYKIVKKHILESEYHEILLPQFEKRFMHMVIAGFQNYMDIDEEYCLPVYKIDGIDIYHYKRIILYGAGKVGRSYYAQIKRDKQIEIAAWIDKDSQKNTQCIPPSRIADIKYDYILVAVYSRNQAMMIKQELCDLGVQSDRILWRKPILFLDDFFLN